MLLSAESLQSTIAKMAANDNVQLTLPKFDVSSQMSLKSMLTNLGMGDALADAADFSGIDGRRDLRIGLAMQKARVQVDEVGTTATAATLLGGLGAGPVPPTVNVVIDHPFLFAIRDLTSGEILFTAQVNDPTASS